MEEVLFEHTGTLGIRHRKQSRSFIPRAKIEIDTLWGAVSGKIAKLPSGKVDFSPEYEDCRGIALANGLRLVEVMDGAKESFAFQHGTHPFNSARKDTETRTSSDSDAIQNSNSATINQAFQQAAAEDESSASSELFGEAGTTSEPSPTAPKAADDLESIQDTLYRWDSSPWGS
jgi:hypothetical protein